MKKILTSVLILLLSTISAVFSQNLVYVEIKKIYDGDTIKAVIKDKYETNEFSVRLHGIDCYETSYIIIELINKLTKTISL